MSSFLFHLVLPKIFSVGFGSGHHCAETNSVQRSLYVWDDCLAGKQNLRTHGCHANCRRISAKRSFWICCIHCAPSPPGAFCGEASSQHDGGKCFCRCAVFGKKVHFGVKRTGVTFIEHSRLKILPELHLETIVWPCFNSYKIACLSRF